MGQHLGGGQEPDRLNVLGPALGGGVKDPHGVHLVSEELHPDGAVHAGGKHVQDSPPEGELAHPIHLFTPDISGGGQLLRQPIQVPHGPHPQLLAAALQRLGRNGPLEQALHRGHQEGVLPFGQLPQQSQPPVLPLAGDRGGVVKGEVPGAQHRDRDPGEGGQVLGQPGPLPPGKAPAGARL